MTKNISDTIQHWLSDLPQGLREHIYRVEEISEELAHVHQVRDDRVRLCAQAHDLCRAMKGGDLLEAAQKLGIPVHPVEQRIPMLLHGPVAAETLRRKGLEDDAVYEGIYYHSTACPGLGPVAKVVFLADKLDPYKAKHYPYLEELKVSALENLDSALLKFLSREVASFLAKGQLIHPASIEARNNLLLSSSAN